MYIAPSRVIQELCGNIGMHRAYVGIYGYVGIYRCTRIHRGMQGSYVAHFWVCDCLRQGVMIFDQEEELHRAGSGVGFGV